MTEKTPIDAPETKKVPENEVPMQLRSETIAYALQGGLGNMLPNFVEAGIGRQFQKYHSTHSADHPGYGQYPQLVISEFAGDAIGAGTLIGAELLFPKQLHMFTRKARSWIDPLYTSLGRSILSKDCSQPEFEQKVQDWKTFQEQNFVRSAIMGVARVGGNVAVQKTVMKNPSPSLIILEGKLLSTVLTTVFGLGVRFAFPKHMKDIDKWLAKNVVTPILDKDEGQDQEAQKNVTNGGGYVDKVLASREESQLTPVR